MPPGGWAPPKPTSGKAIAALICGLVGFVVFCYLPAIAALVGIVLGIIALLETGKEGTRCGRGMAIAGVIISALAVVANAGWIGFIVTMGRMGDEQRDERRAERVEQDQALILERIQEYCEANDGSLGPGGPVLAHKVADNGHTHPVAANSEPKKTPVGGKVTDKLELEHLVGDGELQWARRRGGSGWELVITGQKTATLRARRWDGEILREVEIMDAAKGRWRQTVP